MLVIGFSKYTSGSFIPGRRHNYTKYLSSYFVNKREQSFEQEKCEGMFLENFEWYIYNLCTPTISGEERVAV